MDHTPAPDSANQPDTVTREQGGQFIDEGSMLFTPNLEEAALGGEGDARLADTDRSSVNALQVTMDRSGADYIHTQKAFLTNSGARQITTDSAKLTQSGVLTLNATTAELKQSSAVVTQADAITLTESRAVVAVAETVTTHGGSSVGLLVSNKVDADGDVRAFMILSSDVKAGGTVTSTITPAVAGILGAVCALVMIVGSRLFGKRS
jgi:hypothetical protein